MRLVILKVLILVVATAGAHAADRDQELERLQGTWLVLTNESKDSKTDEDYNRRDRYRLVVDGQRMIWQSNSVGKNEVVFRIYAARKPKALDLDVRDGKVLNECIYQFDGDKLRLCIAHFGKARPKEFEASATSSLVVLRRARDNE